MVKINKEELIDLYINKRYDQEKCAKLLNCCNATIKKNLKKYDIKLRKINLENFKEELIELYVNQEKTMEECSKFFDCSLSLISFYLNKYGVDTKNKNKNRKRKPVSAETRLKMSESRKNVKISKETCEKIRVSKLGKKYSIESRAKMSNTRKERIASGEISTIRPSGMGLKISKTLKRKYANGEIIHSMKGKKKSKESCEKMSKIMKEKYDSGEFVPPMLGKNHSLETRKKISNSWKKRLETEIPIFTGKHHSEETKKKMSETRKEKIAIGEIHIWAEGKKRVFSEEWINKMSKSHIGQEPWNKNKKNVISNEARQKMRTSRIKYIEEENNGKIFPTYNTTACQFFNEINIKYNLDGLHGENKGEHSILGYFLDYYEPSLNLVIEWNEEQHYKKLDNLLKERDTRRNGEIINFLKCEFIIIRQKYFEQEKEFILKRIEGIINRKNKLVNEEKIGEIK